MERNRHPTRGGLSLCAGRKTRRRRPAGRPQQARRPMTAPQREAVRRLRREASAAIGAHVPPLHPLDEREQVSAVPAICCVLLGRRA